MLGLGREAKQQQRAKNASQSVSKKFQTLDRLREGREQLRRAKHASTGRAVRISRLSK